MKLLLTLAGAGILLTSAGAYAQDVQDPASPDGEPMMSPEPMPEPVQTQDIPPSEPPPSEMEPVMDAPNFTDEQITGFARAAMQMRDLNSDPSLDEATRRAQAEMIIGGEGLDPETYSAIGAAAANDPAIASAGSASNRSNDGRTRRPISARSERSYSKARSTCPART